MKKKGKKRKSGDFNEHNAKIASVQTQVHTHAYDRPKLKMIFFFFSYSELLPMNTTFNINIFV